MSENIDIYTTSRFLYKDRYDQNKEKSKELYNNNVFLVCAAGNEGEDVNELTKQPQWTSIGACILKNNKIKRAYYSGISEHLDFMSLTNIKLAYEEGSFTGTSCAAPVFAAMCALVQGFILESTGKKLSNKDLLSFIKTNTIDLEKEGPDEKTGNGLFTLPDPITKIHITHEKAKIKSIGGV